MKIFLRFGIGFLIIGLLFLGIIGFVFYGQGFNKNDAKEEITNERIKELEQKIKDLENSRLVPFPGGRVSVSLTKEQISAIIQLWCPDDSYNSNGFVSLGSGIIIDSQGLIITNRHVISNHDRTVIKSSPTCYVAITDNIAKPPIFKYKADVIAYVLFAVADDFDFDIAILKISDVCKKCEGAPDSLPSSFPFLTTGHSDELGPGDYVSVAGYPSIGANTFTFTEGIVSGRLGDFVIKTDAKIDSGNSGGAALNNNNELIGVPTWTITGESESLGYVIGIDQIMDWYNDKLIEFK